MGISFIRGMVFGTVLTLYVIPAMYTYFTRHDTPPYPGRSRRRARSGDPGGRLIVNYHWSIVNGQWC
jgi:hypothetical protein